MSRKNMFIIILVLVLEFLANCQHSRYRADGCITCRDSPKALVPDKSIKMPLEVFFWGLYPSRLEYNSTDFCKKSEVKEIHEYTSLMNGLYENLTFGIYTPRTLTVSCY